VRETSLFAPNEVHVGQDVGGRTFSIIRDAIERYRNGTSSMVDTQGFTPALVFHSEVYRNLTWYLPNLIGNLHARQEWELFHSLHAGQVVTSRTTVVDRYRKRNREYVVAEVVIADERGRWLQRSRTHQSFLADDPGDAMVVDRDREKRSGPPLRAARRRRRGHRALAAPDHARDCARRSRARARTTTPTRRWRARSDFPTSSCRG